MLNFECIWDVKVYILWTAQKELDEFLYVMPDNGMKIGDSLTFFPVLILLHVMVSILSVEEIHENEI